MTTSFDQYLTTLRRKWTELPAGSDSAQRRSSPDLLSLTDDELDNYWSEQYLAGADVRGWYRGLYRELLRGKKVLEIGSGMGFDGVHFLGEGADWTFCDIAPENLRLIQRIAKLKGIRPYGVLEIQSIESFGSLPWDFDVVWANGSLLNLPFELARDEARAIVDHLKIGGRWIELAYPRERWIRDGRPAFDKWGRMTDGDATPWAEWYDVEKLKQRLFPASMTPLLNFSFMSEQYVWFDMLYVGQCQVRELQPAVQLPSVGPIETPEAVWHYAHITDLTHLHERLGCGEGALAVDIECHVSRGSVGFALATEGGRDFVSRECVLDARPEAHVFTVTSRPGTRPRSLVMRNASRRGSSAFEVLALSARPSL